MPVTAARAPIAFDGRPQIVEALELLEIAIGLEAKVVVAVLVRAARQVERALEASIDVDRNVEFHGPDKP